MKSEGVPAVCRVRRDPYVQPTLFVDIADGRVSRLHCIFRPVAAVPPSIFATPSPSPSTSSSSKCACHCLSYLDGSIFNLCSCSHPGPAVPNVPT
jgi:hypothetical protein